MKSIFEQLDPAMLGRAKKLVILGHIMQQLLPTQAHAHFHVVNINRDTLFVVATSPVWATKIRQLAPQLLKIIHNQRQANTQNANIRQLVPDTLRHIRVLTRPGQIQATLSAKPAAAHKIHRRLSPEAAALLAQTADYVCDDKLSQSLKRLSKHIS